MASIAHADAFDTDQDDALATQGSVACDGVNDETPVPPAGHHWRAVHAPHGFAASGSYPVADVLLDFEPRPPSA